MKLSVLFVAILVSAQAMATSMYYGPYIGYSSQDANGQNRFCTIWPSSVTIHINEVTPMYKQVKIDGIAELVEAAQSEPVEKRLHMMKANPEIRVVAGNAGDSVTIYEASSATLVRKGPASDKIRELIQENCDLDQN